MDKEEIIRICSYYTEHKSYATVFSKSKDLGLITEILPFIQEELSSLSGSLMDAWKLELQGLSGFEYLHHVTSVLARAPVRLTGIKYTSRTSSTIFSFAFNLTHFARSGIKVQGISIISFGVDLSVSGKGPSGKRKLSILKNISGTEQFIPLKKAS